MHHCDIDERSLYMAQIIAERVRNQPELITLAKDNIERWLEHCSERTKPVLLEWKNLLEGNIETALSFLVSESEQATRLRQSSPFAGAEFITNQERHRILEQYRAKSRS